MNRILRPSGFLYDPEQDIFYSTKEAWQRKFGYCRLYDKWAHAFYMVVDCEPIYFEYKGKKWMLELWKGQYGMLTGGEIGLYTKGDICYESVEDEECLWTRFTLYQAEERKVLLQRSDCRWWLTGFKPGEFFWPKQLAMEVELYFPNRTMQEAFIKGILEAGYHKEELEVRANTIRFTFAEPKTKQPQRNKFFVQIIQKINRHNSRRYKKWMQRLINAVE